MLAQEKIIYRAKHISDRNMLGCEHYGDSPKYVCNVLALRRRMAQANGTPGTVRPLQNPLLERQAWEQSARATGATEEGKAKEQLKRRKMTHLLRRVAWIAALTTGTALAGIPECKTENAKSADRVEVCTRSDDQCEVDWSSQAWRGCRDMTVVRMSGLVPSINLWVFSTYIWVYPRYTDSRKMNIVVYMDGKRYERKDVEIEIREGLRLAQVAFEMSPVMPSKAVPTVEAVETGGHKSATHSYK